MAGAAEDLEPGEVLSPRRLQARIAQAGTELHALLDVLRWGRDLIEANFRAGISAQALVRANTELVDGVLVHAWEQTLGEHARHCALVAVGGYGRGELLPHSDVDLLVLTPDEEPGEAARPLEAFLTFLWDLKLDIGHSVRSPAECIRQAAGDITIVTNLMEARLLAGCPELLARVEDGITPDKIWPVDAFYRAKLAEQQARHAKFDNSGYKLEPNIKESPGGLRDIHTILWVAKRRYPGATLADLKRHGLLTDQEAAELVAGQDFLWRVRFALHLHAGRHEDRLLFDHQMRIAEQFGYTEQAHNRAVEQFMQLYFRTIKALSCLNDLLLQLFDEAIVHAGHDDSPRTLNRRFQVRHNYLEVRDPDVFKRQPHALLEVFLLLQKHPELEGVRAETLRLIRRDRVLIDDTVRDDLRTRSLFMEILHQPQGLTHALRRMNRYDVLGRYLPNFGRVTGRMQYDLFHTLTVDEHSLFVVRNMRRLAVPEFRDEHPFFSEIHDRIPKPELLYLSGLFHDIAKGRGGDHSELGAEDAIEFGERHGLPQWDTELVAWLVRNHLVMSMTAQRRDLSDPAVIREFAEFVGDRTHLDYLTLLTMCDIRATNPKLWNSWRESLLKELYRATCRLLSRGLTNPVEREEMAAESQLEVRAALPDDLHPAVEALWMRCEPEYFARYLPGELEWHARTIIEADGRTPLVSVRGDAPRGTTAFMFAKDEPYLFAVVTGVLAQLGLSILEAKLESTRDGYTLDSYVLTEEDGTPVTEAHRIEEIQTALQQTLEDSVSRVTVGRRLSRRLKHFTTPTQVYFSEDTDHDRTIMELVTGDQPGLLSIVGRIFQRRGILLEAAKIGTIGERAEDVFFITDSKGRRIQDPAMLHELRAVITRVLQRSRVDAGAPPESVVI